MARRRHTAEQIIGKLGEAKVGLAKGRVSRDLRRKSAGDAPPPRKKLGDGLS